MEQSKFEDHCWHDIVSDEELEIYECYSRETRVGEQPALLAIDLYNKVYAGGPGPVLEASRKFTSACGDNAWNAIEPTKRLFAAARAAGLPVIYTTGQFSKDVRATMRQRGSDINDGYAIKDDFAPEATDLIIYKERASGFFGTPLVAHLRKMGVNSLIVCGESTSGCVRASVVDGYSNGYHTVVVEDCVFDRSDRAHKASLFDLHHKYADVMKLDEVVAHLEGLTKFKVAV